MNGFKISNPTLLARIEHEELEQFLTGCGWTPHFVEGDDPETMHQLMAGALEKAVGEIQRIQANARNQKDDARPRWPMIVLKSPKGWTGPKVVDGLPIEGTFRSHQVPILVDREHPDHLPLLESWMKSYKAEELFDQDGRLLPELAELAPVGDRRMGANPHANGGILLRDLRMPDFHLHAVKVPSPGAVSAQDTMVLGNYLRDVVKLNQDQKNFRLFGPDETVSNLLGAVFETTNRQWEAREVKNDEFLAPTGRVLDSMLSEHQCEGWLEGYLLTGRHGIFNSYEAFIRIVDSMFSQHAKWLKVTLELPWRRKIASLNYLLASHVWQQDHNGFTHQDPGFLDHVVNKKADIVRVYLPPDANCLMSVMDHCLRSRHYVNVVVAGKHALPQWLNMDEAVKHCTQGIGIWPWASNDQGGEPDLVMACCGDTPTLEILAAVSIMRDRLPQIIERGRDHRQIINRVVAAVDPHFAGVVDQNRRQQNFQQDDVNHPAPLVARDQPRLQQLHNSDRQQDELLVPLQLRRQRRQPAQKHQPDRQPQRVHAGKPPRLGIENRRRRIPSRFNPIAQTPPPSITCRTESARPPLVPLCLCASVVKTSAGDPHHRNLIRGLHRPKIRAIIR